MSSECWLSVILSLARAYKECEPETFHRLLDQHTPPHNLLLVRDILRSILELDNELFSQLSTYITSPTPQHNHLSPPLPAIIENIQSISPAFKHHDFRHGVVPKFIRDHKNLFSTSGYSRSPSPPPPIRPTQTRLVDNPVKQTVVERDSFGSVVTLSRYDNEKALDEDIALIRMKVNSAKNISFCAKNISFCDSDTRDVEGDSVVDSSSYEIDKASDDDIALARMKVNSAKNISFFDTRDEPEESSVLLPKSSSSSSSLNGKSTTSNVDDTINFSWLNKPKIDAVKKHVIERDEYGQLTNGGIEQDDPTELTSILVIGDKSTDKIQLLDSAVDLYEEPEYFHGNKFSFQHYQPSKESSELLSNIYKQFPISTDPHPKIPSRLAKEPLLSRETDEEINRNIDYIMDCKITPTSSPTSSNNGIPNEYMRFTDIDKCSEADQDMEDNDRMLYDLEKDREFGMSNHHSILDQKPEHSEEGQEEEEEVKKKKKKKKKPQKKKKKKPKSSTIDDPEPDHMEIDQGPSERELDFVQNLTAALTKSNYTAPSPVKESIEMQPMRKRQEDDDYTFENSNTSASTYINRQQQYVNPVLNSYMTHASTNTYPFRPSPTTALYSPSSATSYAPSPTTLYLSRLPKTEDAINYHTRKPIQPPSPPPIQQRPFDFLDDVLPTNNPSKKKKNKKKKIVQTLKKAKKIKEKEDRVVEDDEEEKMSQVGEDTAASQYTMEFERLSDDEEEVLDAIEVAKAPEKSPVIKKSVVVTINGNLITKTTNHNNNTVSTTTTYESPSRPTTKKVPEVVPVTPIKKASETKKKKAKKMEKRGSVDRKPTNNNTSLSEVKTNNVVAAVSDRVEERNIGGVTDTIKKSPILVASVNEVKEPLEQPIQQPQLQNLPQTPPVHPTQTYAQKPQQQIPYKPQFQSQQNEQQTYTIQPSPPQYQSQYPPQQYHTKPQQQQQPQTNASYNRNYPEPPIPTDHPIQTLQFSAHKDDLEAILDQTLLSQQPPPVYTNNQYPIPPFAIYFPFEVQFPVYVMPPRFVNGGVMDFFRGYVGEEGGRVGESFLMDRWDSMIRRGVGWRDGDRVFRDQVSVLEI